MPTKKTKYNKQKHKWKRITKKNIQGGVRSGKETVVPSQSASNSVTPAGTSSSHSRLPPERTPQSPTRKRQSTAQSRRTAQTRRANDQRTQSRNLATTRGRNARKAALATARKSVKQTALATARKSVKQTGTAPPLLLTFNPRTIEDADAAEEAQQLASVVAAATNVKSAETVVERTDVGARVRRQDHDELNRSIQTILNKLNPIIENLQDKPQIQDKPSWKKLLDIKERLQKLHNKLSSDVITSINQRAGLGKLINLYNEQIDTLISQLKLIIQN
jgi:hypothetical protein